MKKEEAEEQGNSLHVTSSNPELDRGIHRDFSEHISAILIGQDMDKINRTDEEIGYTEKKEIMILLKFAGIPGKKKDTADENDTEQLSQGMEQKVIIDVCQIKAENNRKRNKTGR